MSPKEVTKGAHYEVIRTVAPYIDWQRVPENEKPMLERFIQAIIGD